MLDSTTLLYVHVPIRSGFKIIIMIGYKWARSNIRSFDFMGWSGLINDLGCPCWTVEYIISE